MFKELLFDYLNQNKPTVIAFVLVTLLTFPLEAILIPDLYGRLYTGIGNKPNQKIFSRLGFIIILIVSVWVCIQLFYYLKNWLLGKILPTYLEFTTKKLFAKIIENYETNYQDIKISKNIARLFELSRDLKDLFYYASSTLLPLTLTVIVVNIYFFYIDWKIGAATMVSLLVLLGISLYFSKKIIDVSAKREEKYFLMNEKVYDSFENLMNVYLNNEKDSEMRKTNKAHDEHTKFYMQQLDYVNNMALSTSSMSVLIFALVIGIAFYNLKKGIFDGKKFVTVSLIVVYFLGFLINITTWTPEELMRLGIIKHSAGFIKGILKGEKRDFVVNPKIKGGDIEFKDITYIYNRGKVPIFKDFSFKIENGSRVAILGSSGSGKTTLMKLLLGLHRLNKGVILINGIPVDKINPKDLRNEVNYINQRTSLFNGTVLDNMMYGNDIKKDDLIALLKKYQLDENFKRLKKGVDSDVGNQGKGTSGGMQKIIMNVRGILKKGSIIIFDEPLAGLDAGARAKMIRLIDDMTKGKTLIIITHDKEILSITKKVIDLEKMRKEAGLGGGDGAVGLGGFGGGDGAVGLGGFGEGMEEEDSPIEFFHNQTF